MGMEIIRLGDESAPKPIENQNVELAKLGFSTHRVPDPRLSIWMMSMTPGLAPLRWWNYSGAIDEDIERLNNLWSVTSAQSFFDCLFLSQFKKIAGPNLYVIAPGYLRADGWEKLPEQSRNAYLRGQGCVYRLEGAFNTKLEINWVPFSQPQSMIKDPSFSAMWPLFCASRNDDVANSMGFFALSDVRKLPQVTNLLIQKNENRSVNLSSVVDWFGLYSSPITPDHGACGVVYSQDDAQIAKFAEFQQKFAAILAEARQALTASPTPQTAFRVLSRFVAI